MKISRPTLVALGGALILGLTFWVADAVYEYYHFNDSYHSAFTERSLTFEDSLYRHIPRHSLFTRLAILFTCLVGGGVSAWYLRSNRQAEERLELALRGGDLGTWDLNVRTNEVIYDERWAEMLGYSLDEISDNLDFWKENIHPDDLPGVMKRIDAYMQGALDNYEVEHRLKHRDGHYVWVISRGRVIARDPNGEPVRVCGTHLDITERKNAEQALRENEEKYRSVVENANEGILVIQDGIRKFYNQRWLEFTGYEAAEYDKQPFLSRIHHEDYDKIKRVYSDFSDGLINAPNVDFRLIAKNGNTIWLNATCSKITWEGQSAEMIFTMDVTDRMKAERALRESEENLRQSQKMESIGRLAGGVAHDFNNMLAVIIGQSQLGLRKTPEDSPLRHYLDDIITAAKRSGDLTRQLLAFARKQEIEPRKIELNDIIEKTLKMLRRLIGENIDLTWEPGTNLWAVNMDPSQIDQILANLAVNARDAIEDDGKLTMETENVTIGASYFTNHSEGAPGDYVMLAVTDDGRGMETETISHIFEPFFTTKAMGEGTGLGLATVYGIVKQNNGFINVYSELGNGTVFKIYLPRMKENGDQDDDLESTPIVVGGDATILLVEDDESICFTVQLMLEDLGYSVLMARTADEACKLAAENRDAIDVLMTDVVMPKVNGRQLVKKLTPDHPNMKVIYMSGYTANVIANHGLLEDGINFISKPFTYEQLAEKLREVLDS